MKNIRYYVSTGELNAMYTLRMLFDSEAHVVTSYGQVESYIVTSDYYICNLSIDIDKANEKAHSIIRNDPLISGADAIGELNAYRERLSLLKAETQATIERERKEQEERQKVERDNTLIGLITSGIMPFGNYRGNTIDSVPLSYLAYMLTFDTDESKGDAVMITLQNAIKTKYPQLVDLPTPTGGYIGEPKQKLEIDCVLVTVIAYDGYYGVGYILKYVTIEGQSLTWFSSRPPQNHDIGDKIKLRFTVKKHDIDKYDNIETTIINRGKVV